MIALFIHSDAEDDLEKIWSVDQESAATIAVLFEEIKGNHDLLDRLTQHNFSDVFHVSKWFEQWNKGKNIWRLKILDLENKGIQYRIVYAFIPSNKHHHVLAIAPREFNYDPNHEITKRILKAYESLTS